MKVTKSTMKVFLFLASSAFSLVSIGTIKPVLAGSLTIISEVKNDSANFKQVDNAFLGQSVKNGDFTITKTGTDNILGNGVDESTAWGFDLSNFKSIDGLYSAFLTLDITPLNNLVSNDGIRIGTRSTAVPLKTSKSFIYVDNEIPSLLNNQGTPRLVNLNLLDFYTPEAISNIFKTNGGIIPFYYADDSSISNAKLTLSIPEPSSISGLFALSILGVSSVLCRKTQLGR